MRRYTILLSLSVALTGCALLVPQRPLEPIPQLRRDVARLLSDSLFIPAAVSLKVISLQTDQVLVERNPFLLFHPASNVKLLTSAAALSILDPSYAVRTVTAVDPSPDEKIIAGNVYLKGFGDPDLTTADLDSLASMIAARGITLITKDVVVDATAFDQEYFPGGWMWDDEPDPDGAPVSALSVNKNCVRVTVVGDPADTTSLIAWISPSTSFVTLVNCASRTADSVTTPIRFDRLFRERSNTILISGQLDRAVDTASERVTIWQPELYAGTLFHEALARRGVTVLGSVRFGALPSVLPWVAQIQRPLDSVLTNLNKVSDNLSAEMMLKSLATATGHSPGTTLAGRWAMNRVLAGFDIDTTKHRIVDGSGVSHYNLITCDALIRLLRGMYRSPDLFPRYYASLPIAGRDGTIARRMKRTAAEGNVRAKTGTLSGVSTLSGYVLTRDREPLAFSMMMQNYIGSERRFHAVQDSIAALLASFTRHPVLSGR